MFKSLKLGTNILIAFLIIALISVGVTAYFAYARSKSALEQESFNKLTAVREMKAGQIEDYFQRGMATGKVRVSKRRPI